MPGDAVLAEAVGRVSPRPASRVTELSLHLPSLDEVFFTLTGAGTPTTGGRGIDRDPRRDGWRRIDRARATGTLATASCSPRTLIRRCATPEQLST